MSIRRHVMVAGILVSFAVLLASENLAQGQRGGRDQLTQEQREAAARRAYEEEAARARPIAALDSVWIEELTYLEVRDAARGRGHRAAAR